MIMHKTFINLFKGGSKKCERKFFWNNYLNKVCVLITNESKYYKRFLLLLGSRKLVVEMTKNTILLFTFYDTSTNCEPFLKQE